MADVGWVQEDLARTYALLEAQKLLNWRMTAAVADDTLGPADSSAVKVFGTESTVEIYRRLLGDRRCRRLPAARARPERHSTGELERAGRQAQINTFGGGVNEVQREILATAGLGMKRSAR